MIVVIIIGGSFGGLSAAIQLARARRSVLIINAGKSRNRFSPVSHGFLGQDGKNHATILNESIRQIRMPFNLITSNTRSDQHAQKVPQCTSAEARPSTSQPAKPIMVAKTLPGLVEQWSA
jgi:thioredoxin reductase